MKIDQAGRSLVELTVVLALVAILAATAVPQLASAGTRYRERAAVAEVASELRTARLLALSRRERVEARLGDDGRTVIIATVKDPHVVLRRYELPALAMSMEGWSVERTLRFQPNGRSATPTTIILNGTDGARWTITVSMTGRVGVS